MNFQRQIAYSAALLELNFTDQEREMVASLHTRLTETLQNASTPVTEQVVFAFNDALKAGAGPRRRVLDEIVKYTDTLISFGIAGHSSCVPQHTISVIQTFFNAARPPVDSQEPVPRELVLV